MSHLRVCTLIRAGIKQCKFLDSRTSEITYLYWYEGIYTAYFAKPLKLVQIFIGFSHCVSRMSAENQEKAKTGNNQDSQEEIKTEKGGCHCRKFEFEYDCPSVEAKQPAICNCSYCTIQGAVMMFVLHPQGYQLYLQTMKLLQNKQRS